MHPLDMQAFMSDIDAKEGMEFCPVVADWSDDKWQFCIRQWRNITGFSGGNFVLVEDSNTETECDGEYKKDDEFVWPIPFSASPTMFSYDLFSHEATLDLLEETRAHCDDGELRCWLTGIPYDYWSQYEGIFLVLVEIAGFSALVGFLVAWVFLFARVGFFDSRDVGKGNAFMISVFGAFLIVVTILLSLTCVIGLSILSGVSLTGFSNMSFVLSTAFSVEYSVHIVSKYITADPSHYKTSLERVQYCMSFLMIPTFMSFVSSVIGVVCLAFTEFEFTHQFFFKPLIIVMFITYFYGCWWLPSLLTLIPSQLVHIGDVPATDDAQEPIKDGSVPSKENAEEKESSEEESPEDAEKAAAGAPNEEDSEVENAEA